MDKDCDLELNKVTKKIEELKLNSHYNQSDALQNFSYKPRNGPFVEIDSRIFVEENLSCIDDSQNFDLNNNIKNFLRKNKNFEDDKSFDNDVIKKEIEEIGNFFKVISLTDSPSSDDESLDVFKKETEDGDNFFKVKSLTDSLLSDDENFNDGVIKKESEDGDDTSKVESLTDSSSSDDEHLDDEVTEEIEEEEYSTDSSSSDEDDENLRERGPDRHKTKKHEEKFYKRGKSVSSTVVDRPTLCHPSNSVPIFRNRRSYQQVQRSFSSNFGISSRPNELGCSPESLYVLSPDSGFGSPSQPLVPPSPHITSSQYTFPLTPASPASPAVSISVPTPSQSIDVSPSTVIGSPADVLSSVDISLPSVDVGSPSVDFSPSEDIGSPSAHITSPSYISSLRIAPSPSSDAAFPSAPIASPTEDAVLQLTNIASSSSHSVPTLPPNASSSSNAVSSSLDSVLPFNYENDKERKISELIGSFKEAEKYFNKRRETQLNSNQGDIEQFVLESYDLNEAEETNTVGNLENESTSLEDMLSQLIISGLLQESDAISEESWNDSLNFLYDSACNSKTNETTTSGSRNSKNIKSKFSDVRQLPCSEQKISYQIKDSAKKALRNSRYFDVDRYLNEMKNILTKIKDQEKSKEEVKIIDYDERENYKNLNQTNLHSAVIESNIERVLCLVEILKRYDHAFFDINCRDVNKKTALDYALQKNFPLLVNYLKENNAVKALSV